jgi:hypothetical protein
MLSGSAILVMYKALVMPKKHEEKSNCEAVYLHFEELFSSNIRVTLKRMYELAE